MLNTLNKTQETLKTMLLITSSNSSSNSALGDTSGRRLKKEDENALESIPEAVGRKIGVSSSSCLSSNIIGDGFFNSLENSSEDHRHHKNMRNHQIRRKITAR